MGDYLKNKCPIKNKKFESAWSDLTKCLGSKKAQGKNTESKKWPGKGKYVKWPNALCAFKLTCSNNNYVLGGV